MGKLIDMTGQKFGRLTILKRVGNSKCGHIKWLCRCDCGIEKSISGHDLRRGTTKSCGCLNKEGGPCKKPGVAAFNGLYSNYCVSAKRRGLIFSLSKEQFRKLTQQHCYYCETPPNSVHFKKSGNYTYNGVDRVDNTRGYLPENCVPCCGICNKMKQTLPYKDFLDHVKRIHYHSL